MSKLRFSLTVLILTALGALACGQTSTCPSTCQKNAGALVEKARIQIALKHYPEAMALLTSAARLEPGNAGIANLCGVICLQRNDLPNAAAYLRKAMKLDPKDAHTYNNMGALCHLSKDYTAAIRWYHKALELEPTGLNCLFNLANTYFTNNMTVQGMEAIQKIFRQDPGFFGRSQDGILVGISSVKLAEQYYCIAKLYAQAGDQEKALHFLEKSISAGFGNLGQIRNDKDFAPLREDTRFQSLVGLTAQKI